MSDPWTIACALGVVPFTASSVLKIVTTYAPPTHTFLKRPFLTDFKKHTHTPPPPPTERNFSALDQNVRNP